MLSWLPAESVKDELIDIQKTRVTQRHPVLESDSLRLEIAPKLRRLLYQAKVSWTPGGLLLISLAAWLVATYLIYLKTGAFFFSVGSGIVPAGVPLGYVLWKRGKRFLKV